MTHRPRVLLTRLLPNAAIELLKKHFVLEINTKNRAMTKTEILDKIGDQDGLISLLTDTIDAEIIETGENLKIIANYAVGYDNIDATEATKRKIPVTNTPDVLTETTADLTCALLLSVARRIVEADGFVRDGKFRGWEPMLLLGSDIHGKTLGIIGFGRIGRAVARRTLGFNMRIIYHELERLSSEVEKAYCAEYRGLDDLLKEADFVSIHTPLTDSTYHLIGERELLLMKKTAFLINTSRGQIVDEKALVRALQEKKIAGCALDVFEREPAVERALLTMPNAVLVPHIGSASVETRTKMAMMVAQNVIAVLVKKTRPPNIVNPDIYE